MSQKSHNKVPQTLQAHSRPVEERKSAGKALRERCPRGIHEKWKVPTARRDPIEILMATSVGRVPDLIPIRYGRMLTSPFTFYRGAAAVMAGDLARSPATGIYVQACGDCHLLNFGGFATPERKIIFDINDFDETSVAFWEWDVKRLAVSFVVAGRSNGFDAADCREAAWCSAHAYHLKMLEYADTPLLEAWYDAIDLKEIVEAGEDEELRRFMRKKILKASEKNSHEQEFAKLTVVSGDHIQIKDVPPLIFHLEETKGVKFHTIATKTLQNYAQSLAPHQRVLLERYELVDAAVKVVGVGSVGTLCGILLMMSGNGDPLFLQFKEARQSVLEPYAGASPYAHRGERVVHGQRLMQAATDIFLGWATGAGEQARHFYFRQLRDAKIKPVIEVMNSNNLKSYAKTCGRALARAHVRSTDAVSLAAYLGKGNSFEDAIALFSQTYADLNERDHAALKAAVRAGRIEAVMEQS